MAPFAAANARTADNQLIALPVDIAPAVMFYRKDAANATGYDFSRMTSWDEYLEAGLAATQDTDGDGAVDQWMLSSAQELAVVSINNGIGCWINKEGELMQPKEKFISILEMVEAMDKTGIHVAYSSEKNGNNNIAHNTGINSKPVRRWHRCYDGGKRHCRYASDFNPHIFFKEDDL